MIRSIAIAVLAAACSGTTAYVGHAQHPIAGTPPAPTAVARPARTGTEKVVDTQTRDETKTPASQPAPQGVAR